MSTMLSLTILTLVIIPCLSQTDVQSFTITTSADSGSGTHGMVILTLSWNMLQYKCIINETNGIQPDTSYGCSLWVPPYAKTINSLSSNQYLMKIELTRNDSDLIRIAGVKVIDEDGNYYGIDSFCLPPQFSNTAAASINMQSLQCCYWSQRQKYNFFSMGNTETASLVISYVQFRSDVLNHKNEGHEGAVKPPKIDKLGIKTSDSGSSSGYNLKVHWDTDEYTWSNLVPKDPHTTYQTVPSFTQSCQFLTGFNLEISTSDGSDSLDIDSIIVIDEANYEYTIDTFCVSGSVDDSSKYSQTNTKCSMHTVDIVRDSYAYDGFIYTGNKSVYFMWDKSLFSYADEAQQGFAMNDYIILGWLHSSTCVDSISPYSKVTIHKDDMADAENTGWTFSGSHTAPATAVNCPGGYGNPCSRIAGGGSMDYTLDVSQYINIIVQYEMVLSSMPTGKTCYLYYTFDDGTFIFGQSRTSTTTEAIPYHNESFTMPDYLVNGYTTLSISFSNDATADTDYCWFDNFYVFGDYLIQYDNCNNSTGWDLFATSFSADANCPNGMCLPLTKSNAYGTKQYPDIQYYSNMVLTVDVQIDSQLLVYYWYGDEQPQILTPSTASSGIKQIFDIPAADICASSPLHIKFMTDTNALSYVDNIKLSGIVLKTLGPTISPTPNPTDAPTVPTFEPTFYPTVEPTIPTLDPTVEPTTHIPTNTTSTVSGKGGSNSKSTNMAVFVIVMVVIVGVFIMIFIFLWWYKKRKTMHIPGADLGKPLLGKNDGNGRNVEAVIELKNVGPLEKYDMDNVGHPIPGVAIGWEGGTGENSIQRDEIPSSSESENGLAQQLQQHLEKASIGTSDHIYDEMKEAEIIGAINETPQ